jgi:glycosyltransferase involved in cell wall biosynthesis
VIRVGLLGHGFVTWTGGVDFLRGVASSLHHADPTVELHALVPSRGPRLTIQRAVRHTYHGARRLIGRSNSAAHATRGQTVADLAHFTEHPVALHEIDIGAQAIARQAKRLSLDVLIPSISPLPASFPIPWVGYLYDFQHRYLPQLFTAAERAQRDAAFAAMLERARTVIVNARAVESDAARFHPGTRAKIFALPFNAAPRQEWLLGAEAAPQRHGISSPYFIVCNQFWQHKDHGTAFEAFARVAAPHPDLELVCTGLTDDYRAPDYFADLQRLLARLGLSDRVRILGLLPKADQIDLMKGALALVQPTLFEGGPGGGAVYDAVALGVPCLVSDIPVNREITEPGIEFFPVGDPIALAALMDSVARGPVANARDVEALEQRGHARRAACGAQLLAAIDHARSDPRRR